MKRTNKKLHQWAKENNCHIWGLRKKLFWQNTNEANATYKVAVDFMVTYNGYMVMNKTAFEVFDAALDATVFVTTHGVVNKEHHTDTWQMYRQ